MRRVEDVALAHYNKEGYPKGFSWTRLSQQFSLAHKMKSFRSGLHDEGGAIWMFFTLLFYDIVFARVYDSFHWRQQTQPLDMFSLEFYANRKKDIDVRLREIRVATSQVC